MKTKYLITGVALATIIVGAILLRQDNTPAPSTLNDEPIKIGVIAMLSGKAKGYGIPNRRGIEMAINEINANGGINGRPLQAIYEEEGDSDDQIAINSMEKLISQDEVNIIIGPQKSATVLAVAPNAEMRKVFLYAPNGTTPSISTAGEYIYRGCSKIDQQTEALAQYTYNTIQKKTVAILYSNEPYGQGSQKLYKSAYEKLGGKILIELPFNRGDKDYKTQLLKIKELNPEALYIPGYASETAPAAIQAREVGLNQPIIGVYGNMIPSYIEVGGSAVEGSVMAVEYDEYYSTTKNLAFAKNYNQAVIDNKEPNNIMFAALSYDAMYVIADGMKKYGTTAEDVMKYLDEVQDYDGVTGKLSYDQNGDIQKGDVILVQVKDKKFIRL